MIKFTVTYDIVTHESAEHGDAAERGFVLSGGWHQSTDDMSTEEMQKLDCEMSLREAVDLINTAALEDNGTWFSEVDSRENYRTGEHETRALHPPRNITASSYRRLARLLETI
jgi:hypothetical protein